jgi:hypothetical protein
VKEKKGSWVVKMRCSIIKNVVLEDCTKEEAENNTWAYSVEETETSMEDWEILGIEPNE